MTEANAPTGERVPADVGTLHELSMVMDRMVRRHVEAVGARLRKLGFDDISPAHALMLQNIGTSGVSVRNLMERGAYNGTNLSYCLKNLLEAGYISRGQSAQDRRSASIRLTDKGTDLCERLRELSGSAAALVVRSPGDARDLDAAWRTARRLEVGWTLVTRGDDVVI